MLRLSWKMKLAISVSVLWVLFWLYGAWADQEPALDIVIGFFPVAALWVFWAAFGRKKKSDSEEYVWISKYVRTKQKRKHDRLVYPTTKRPLLKTGEHELEIIDISEKGIKLLNDKNIELDQAIQGTAVLLSGKTITVEGEVTWCTDKECSLHIVPIPKSILSKEKRIVSKA